MRDADPTVFTVFVIRPGGKLTGRADLKGPRSTLGARDST
jgi:ABC-type phosphate/phosphonate transport system substrate-binding protein